MNKFLVAGLAISLLVLWVGGNFGFWFWLSKGSGWGVVGFSLCALSPVWGGLILYGLGVSL